VESTACICEENLTFEPPLNTVILIVGLIILTILFILFYGWKTSLLQTKRADWGFIVPTSLIFISALFVTAWDFIQIQKIVYRFGIVNAVGLFVGLMGFSIRRIAKWTLGKYFSSGLKTLQTHELVKRGIYKYVRHPGYLGAFLAVVGIPLFFSSLYGFLLMLGLFPCYLYRIRIEESMLLEKFGDEYREYIEKSKKMIPFFY